jgi:hypothetical protein
VAGVLQFTIGLEASQFLHNCGLSSAAIIGLERVGAGLRTVMEKVWASIDQAHALNHLAARTGETAGNLFKLQEAFKACGVDSESVGQTLFFMQKSLGGVNDVGESTADIFSKIGLNIKDLKDLGPLQAFTAIIDRLGKLNQNSAAKAASGIFGRMGAGNTVQLSRQAKEFREALEDASPLAAIFDRMATGADLLSRTLLKIERNFSGFWAGIAEGAIPGLQKVFDYLKSFNLTDIGKQIGAVVGLLGESVGNGRFSEILSLAIEVGFEKGEFFAVRLAGSLGAALMAVVPKALEAAFVMSKMAGTSAIGMMLRRLSTVATRDLNQLESDKAKGGIPGRGPWSAQDEEYLQRAKSNASLALFTADIHDANANKSATDNIRTFSADIATSMPQAMAAAREAWKSIGGGPESDASKHLAALMADYHRRINAAVASKRTDGGEDVEFGKGMHHRTEGNVFEKMGFVTGAGSPAHDTARNTAKLVTLFEQVRDGIFRENMRRVQTDWPTNDIL